MVNDFLKILLLEDEIKDAEIIQHKLMTHGNQYVFKQVMSEPDYVNALHEFKPHVILSDTSMPQFSAAEALRILQSTPYHIPFILVTGNASEEFAADIIKMGADDYLLKDRLARLPAAIEAALKQKEAEREKKAAAEKLKKSEENYRSMLDRVAEAFIAIDKSWHCTYINKKAGEIFSADPLTVVGKNIWAGLPGAAGMIFNTVFHQAMKNQQHAVFETFYPPSSIWLECHIYPSADGLSVFCNDITGRKKTEERIKASEEKYRLLNDQAFDAILIYAPDGSILESNQSAAVNTGYSREELASLNITALFLPEHLQKRPISFDLLKAG